MGVPKFFRWMSERYPAISQLIAENRIPEFDCLYLDMSENALGRPSSSALTYASQTALSTTAHTKIQILLHSE